MNRGKNVKNELGQERDSFQKADGPENIDWPVKYTSTFDAHQVNT